MASYATLPKRLRFAEENRSQIVFSDVTKIRLDPLTNSVKLKEGISGYSTDPDIYVISPLTSPQAVHRWIGFHADVVHVKDTDGTVLTNAKYRLHDGTNQYY